MRISQQPWAYCMDVVICDGKNDLGHKICFCSYSSTAAPNQSFKG